MIQKKSSQTLKKAVAILQEGGVVICPTDTVYGFLADASNKKAVEKIYKIKKRPRLKPLPLFVRDLVMTKELAEMNLDQEKIIKKHWPGKYTFVLKRKKGAVLYGVDKKTVALRIPKHKFLNALLKKVNRPLVQTSVNISGNNSLSNIQDITREFDDDKRIDMIIDGGTIKKAKSSKVIDISQSKNNILRS